MAATQTVTQRRQASAPAEPSAVKAPKVSKGGVVVDRVPAERPPFTVGDIRNAIPAHCFDRPLTKSFGYLIGDSIIVYALYVATQYIPLLSDAALGATVGPLARGLAWLAYWIAQGGVLTGLWVIGHECGHRGFAESELINDVVGLVVHSALLVPYFAWQISHRRHHSNTGSIEHDEVFVPPLATPEQIKKLKEREAGKHDDDGAIAQLLGVLHRAFFIVVMLTLGWPGYLIANLSGNQTYHPKAWVNHFFPTSPIFNSGQKESDAHNQRLILISDVALFAFVAILYKWTQISGASYVFFVYGMPYLIVNFWLVLITYLQHTDLNLPHYTADQWDWLRGALATVDRDYGFMNIVLHHITDTHVVHHLFSTMPHYHAQEATEAVKKLLGPYYRMDRTPIAVALWNSFRDCDAVYPDDKIKGVHWFEPM